MGLVVVGMMKMTYWRCIFWCWWCLLWLFGVSIFGKVGSEREGEREEEENNNEKRRS